MSRFAPSSPVPFDPAVTRALASNEDRLDAQQIFWSRIELAFSPAGSIYHGYPFLFAPAFPGAPFDRVTTLALATRYFYDSLFVADGVMDGEYAGERLTHGTLQLETLQLEAYSLLHGLFAPEVRFWCHFREWMGAYAEACHEERQLAAPGARWRFDEASARRMATGKCGLAKISVAGLAELAGEPGPMEAICRSVDGYYVARQMIDDLSDWRVDFERGFPSLLLARVLTSAFDGDREAMAADVRGTARAIYLQGHAEHTLQVGLRALDEAEEHLSGLPPLPFEALLRTLRGQYEGVLVEVATAACRPAGSTSVALSAPDDDPWSAMALQALRHLMPRPGEGAVLSLIERAYRLEALVEADRWLDGGLAEVIAAEGDQLVARRLRTAPGGWRFTGAAPGLPPDLWHVAQVGLALEAAGREPEVDGSVEPSAWINCSVAPPGLWALADRPWRRPQPDAPDVVAIATWLRLLDACGATAPAAEAARRWLLDEQGEDGAWRSSGSDGPYLATCAAVQALVHGSFTEPLRRARRYLLASQGRGGGWGNGRASRPSREEADGCSTALALLTLAMLEEWSPSEESAERAAQGWRWIDGSGLFDSASGERPTRVLTASFLLRAALRWSRVAGRSGGELAVTAADEIEVLA